MTPTPVLDALRRLAADASERAWDDAFPVLGPVLCQAALRATARGDLIDDAVQEALLRLRRHLTRFVAHGEPQARAWLARLAQSAAVDLARREARGSGRFQHLRGDCVAVVLPSSDDSLRAALAALPAAQRRVIELRYLAQLDITSVANLLGWSKVRVQVTVFRALRALRRRLAHRSGASDGPALPESLQG